MLPPKISGPLPTPADFAAPRRNGLSGDDLFAGMMEHLFYTLGRSTDQASAQDLYLALSHAVRDRLMTRLLAHQDVLRSQPCKAVAYLSAEFLIGPQLGNNLLMLGIHDQAVAALRRFGVERIESILDVEEEPGLGNGGLGRLAACFLESLATLEIPATGYGIRYEFGIFDQVIRDGAQVEITDTWLKGGWPWEIVQPEQACQVGFGGSTRMERLANGRLRVEWTPAEVVVGIPYDVPVLGYRVNTCDRLRLWRAEASEAFDFHAFNAGEFDRAVEAKVGSETLSKVLYPNDGTAAGRRLRLKQQAFFVSCSLQDMLRNLRQRNLPVTSFAEHWAVQLNDTHPAIAVAELMRLLLDEYHLDWETAWSITHRAIAYTNHTLLPEALECWDLSLFAAVLPRHLEVIYEINSRFLRQVRRQCPDDPELWRRVSIIGEDGCRTVRMAHLATVAAHRINGVAALHSTLVRTSLLFDFATLFPERFTNITNGVSPRRWLALANPSLHSLLVDVVGPDWPGRPDAMGLLEPLAADGAFLERWARAKRMGKLQLARLIEERSGLVVDVESLFAVQVKRIHEYKRQHLNVLGVIGHYLRIKAGDTTDLVPRTVIFGGKAAPGYRMAKLIIRFINGVAAVINGDPACQAWLRVVFLEDYNVKLGEKVYPAADLSEQISTAGLEASGTGNMKFTMNGALTIGTLDGANVEIRELVGANHFFLFGHSADQIRTMAANYRPWEWLETTPWLREALHLIEHGHFSGGDKEIFRPLVESLVGRDPFFVLADLADYGRAQGRVDAHWRDQTRWWESSVLNSARSGFFSSDRAIREYAEGIWDVRPRALELATHLEAVGRGRS